MKLAMAVAAIAFFETGQSDEINQSRAKNALIGTGFKYEATASGKSYQIIFDHPAGRRQTIYMPVKPQVVGGLITYNFYTTVWASKTPPNAELLRKTMGISKKLGSYYVFKDSNNVWAIRFQVKFDATDMKEAASTTDPLVVAMKDTIFFVNAVGEETDKSLNGDKDTK